MRYSWTALLGLSVFAVPLNAQGVRGAPPPPTTSRAPRRVSQPTTPPSKPAPSPSPIQLEDQWTTALVKRDVGTFDRLLAPNFVYTENASVMNRGDVIKGVTGPDKVEWARNEGMKLRDFGDVQVITGVLHVKGKGTKGSFDRRYQFTDTWQRRKGSWQIVAAQDYLIPG
ncbi:MAG TPA: nuclear transport factor 2 family protein [Gemmatimonadaceae bacterium]|nr:nuclear transport factor 2 family protein [Gemmatimonadaceae bacterium]